MESIWLEAAFEMAGKAEQPVSKKRKQIDFKLAGKLEDTRAVRIILREHGGIILWPSKEKTNCFNLETVSFNFPVMSVVLSHICSTTTTVKAPAIDYLKAQAFQSE